jgi:AraC family transcriptional regulator
MQPTTNRNPDYFRNEYFRRVHKAIDFLDANLSREVSLEELAAVACFSKFHFHRIFKEVTGETVGQFALRLRLQRAASELVFNHAKNVTAIAYDCGFAESSVFSRAFRQRYGASPSQWRKGDHVLPDSNQRQMLGNQCQSLATIIGYPAWTEQQPEWRMKMTDMKEISVTIEDMPDLTVACVRHVGSYSQIGSAFDALYAWAGPRGLANPPAKVLGIYYDMPGSTTEDKLRSDACVTVAPGTKAEGNVSVKTIPSKGKYALGHFEFDGKEGFQKAWNAMFAVWLPQSGYQCDDRPTFELYRNDCQNDHYLVDICIPVRPL